MTAVKLVKHPLAQDALARLRNRETDVPQFRALISQLAIYLAITSTEELRMQTVEIETPVTKAEMSVAAEEIVLVPILRAGLGMVEGMLTILTRATVGHLGLYRDHETLQPIEYYANTPGNLEERMVIVLDPMLATGGSASAALTRLKERGAKRLLLASIIAAPEGIERLEHDHPDVQVVTISIDQKLNERGYIVPGLGDAGDRMFGTL